MYVGARRSDFTFAGADPARSSALAERVDSLGLVDHAVEDAEAPWRALVHQRRLDRLARHEPGPRLLDVGCSTGEFLVAAAGRGFDVLGLEPDPGTSETARERTRLPVKTGTLDDSGLADGSFDVATLWHVIEHLDSPRRVLERLHRVVRAGGVLAIETPAVDNVWFRLLPSRWRQLIPDHYFFFSRATIRRLLEDTGFQVLELEKVGRPMSGRFVADRVRRLNPALGALARRALAAARAEDRTIQLSLGDVMLVFARRRERG